MTSVHLLFTAVCVHQGVTYPQGASWKEGCSRSCRCDDAANNVYSCFDRSESKKSLYFCPVRQMGVFRDHKSKELLFHTKLSDARANTLPQIAFAGVVLQGVVRTLWALWLCTCSLHNIVLNTFTLTCSFVASTHQVSHVPAAGRVSPGH